MTRGAWQSNTGFLLAAIGSAVGLGNIWRFSYLVYKNGGGSFLVPYVIALFVVGIPILILEFAIGHRMRASAPKAMHAVHPRLEWVGWWPVTFVMFGIMLYYTVVIAWFGLYMLGSFGGPLHWGDNSQEYFFTSFLNFSGDAYTLGGIQWPILAATAFFWGLLWSIGVWQVDKGVERACRIFMPVLAILTLIMVGWGFTLEGAGEGIKAYLTPDWTQLSEPQVWREAFGQIFFSLSIGFGIMIAYASYLPEKTDLVRNAFITSIANCSFSFIAGFAVFSVLGFMAANQGVPIDEVAAGGPGLCFVVYPTAINLLPFGNGIFGFLFFLTLVLAGLTSAMSIIEAFTAAAVDKFKWSRKRTVSVICAAGFVGSIIFTTGAGLIWLDIVDRFLNNYGLVLVGLLECLVIAWYFGMDKMHFHLSEASEGGYSPAWDKIWNWSVTFVAPVVLIIILAWSVYDDLSEPYEGYPVSALVMIGVGWLVATFLISGIFSVFTNGEYDHIERPELRKSDS